MSTSPVSAVAADLERVFSGEYVTPTPEWAVTQYGMYLDSYTTEYTDHATMTMHLVNSKTGDIIREHTSNYYPLEVWRTNALFREKLPLAMKWLLILDWLHETDGPET